MTLTWQDISEEELETAHLLPEGRYDFEVLEALPANSKETNQPMIRLKLKIFDHQGNQRIVFDVLMTTPRMLLRLKHFVESIGVPEKYASKNLTPEECVGKKGRVYIIREPKKENKNGGFYDAKNSVKDYITPNDISKNLDAPKQHTGLDDHPDDEIPF